MPGARARNMSTILSLRATQADVGRTVLHLSLWDAATGGNFLMSFLIHEDSFSDMPNQGVQPLILEAQYRIRHRDLNIVQTSISTLNDANVPVNMKYHETPAMAERALKGRLAGPLFIQFHWGTPGPDGTNGVINGIGRVEISGSDFRIRQFISGDGSIPAHTDTGTVDGVWGPDPGHDDHGDGPSNQPGSHTDDFGSGAG